MNLSAKFKVQSSKLHNPSEFPSQLHVGGKGGKASSVSPSALSSGLRLRGSDSRSSKDSRQAQSMAELMQRTKKTFIAPKKGEVIEGTITKLTPSEILVDINAKTEAVVLEKDKKLLRNLLSTLKVGDRVNVSVLSPESDMGYPVVSLRRFLDDIVWERLEAMQKSQEPISVTVTALTKGGYLVSTKDGIAGFLPGSQVTLTDGRQDIVGADMKAHILELSRPTHKIIFSQKATISDEEFSQKTKKLTIGQKIEAIVTNITSFGVFTMLQLDDKTGIDGLIHISEISWEKVSNLEEMFQTGQKIQTVVINIDKEAKRVDLSIKRLSGDPFEAIAKKYSVDQKVKGIVSQITDAGVVVAIEEGVEGLIRKEKIPPTVSYEVGGSVQTTVSQIDKKRRKLVLVPVLLEKPIGYR